VPAAAALVTVSATIALADFPTLFLIDAGAAEALAIAYLAAFATIPTAIAFAVFAELPLMVALVAKIGAVVFVACFLNKRFHRCSAVCNAGTDRRSRGNRNGCQGNRSCN